MAKVYKIVIKGKSDCCRCPEKIRKAICSLCACEINSNTFDEKSNTITLIGNFDPQKVKRKICQKAGKCIESLEWSEMVKKPDSGSDSSSKKKDPPPPPPKEVAGDKTKAGEKDGAKEKDKGSKEKKDPPSPELVGPVVIVVVPPPAPTPAPALPDPKPKPVPDPPKKPHREVIACAPVLGAPVGWCHCGPCHCGCHYRPCPWPGYVTRPCTCGCSNRCDPCSISSQGCPGNCVIFTEEDTCKTM